MLLEIPPGFSKNLIRFDEQKLFVAVNAINGIKAGLGGSYLNKIISDYNGTRQDLNGYSNLVSVHFPVIDIASSNWFNPLMNYKLFMVPGILALLITMIGAFLVCLKYR